MCRVDFPSLTIKCATDLVSALRTNGLTLDTALLALSVAGSSVQTIGNLDFFKRPNIFGDKPIRSNEEILAEMEQCIDEACAQTATSHDDNVVIASSLRTKLAELVMELLLSLIFG